MVVLIELPLVEAEQEDTELLFQVVMQEVYP